MEIEKLTIINENKFPFFSKWKNLPYTKRDTWGFSNEEMEMFESENRRIWLRYIYPLLAYLNKKPEEIQFDVLKKFAGDLTMQKYLYQILMECKSLGLNTDTVNQILKDAIDEKKKK